MSLVERFINGDNRALSRLISHVENENPKGLEAVNSLYSRTGHARIIGFTGPPGAGKSTIVNKVARSFREQGLTIGIIAVDPTSPFTGGAILGDRIRMAELSEDEGVFIRSMSTRGALGGLALATDNVIHLMDAFGKDVIILETVGVGQSEVDIVKTADTTVVIEVPGLGDGIQAIKAGILEIGDVFVVNKSDSAGADRVYNEIRAMLTLGHPTSYLVSNQDIDIVKTTATTGEGIDELVAAINNHHNWLVDGNHIVTKRAGRREVQFKRVLVSHVVERFKQVMDSETRYHDLIAEVLKGKRGPYDASEELISLFIQKV